MSWYFIQIISAIDIILQNAIEYLETIIQDSEKKDETAMYWAMQLLLLCISDFWDQLSEPSKEILLQPVGPVI